MSESESYQDWNEDIFSSSTNRLLTEMQRFTEGADLLQLLEILFKIHKEYGTHSIPPGNPYLALIQFLRQQKTFLKLSKYESREWAEKVLAITSVPQNFPDINGRMFLLAALFSEFDEINQQLSQDPEWGILCGTLTTQLEAELLKEKEIDFPVLLSDQGLVLRNAILSLPEEKKWEDHDSLVHTKNLSDGPTKDDALSRRTLAQYLAKRLRHIYHRDIATGQQKAFFMHIDGAWGSGKSTLLGFLQDALEDKAPQDDKIEDNQKSQGEWVVVNFNAWEYQRLDQPWWFLMKTVYKEALLTLRKRSFHRCASLWLTEMFWRLNPKGRYFPIAIIALIIFVFAVYHGASSASTLGEIPLVGTLSFLFFIWSSAKTIGSSLLSGSAKAAQDFVEQNSSNPMQKLTEHFRNLIKEIEYPTAIFIDDLDRCNEDYGIKLLEGLQTIYKNVPVVYVVAADRKWLSKMYEDEYSLFAPVITKPAKPFGLVFLDKTFQLIVELPEISATQKALYWSKLLNVSDEAHAEEESDVISKVEKETNLQGQLAILDSTIGIRAQQIVREQIVNSISIQEEEKVLEHRLQKFIDLIAPNPRAMKRLINDISTAKAMTILYNQRVEEDQLILWTILKLQYPALAQMVWEEPEKLALLLSDAMDNKEYFDLLKKTEVRQLFEYSVNGKTIRIDEDFVRKMRFQEVEKNL